MMSDDPRNSSHDRTDLAQDRTLLATERTFAGWMRTGLALVAVALGLSALFRAMEPLWVAKAIGTAFVLIGVFVFWAAERRACQVHRRLTAHAVQPFGGLHIRVIAWSTILVSVSVVAAIWILV